MHNSIIHVYKIAKRITYDYDLLKQDLRKNELLAVTGKKRDEVESHKFKVMGAILGRLVREYEHELITYYVTKVNEII